MLVRVTSHTMQFARCLTVAVDREEEDSAPLPLPFGVQRMTWCATSKARLAVDWKTLSGAVESIELRYVDVDACELLAVASTQCPRLLQLSLRDSRARLRFDDVLHALGRWGGIKALPAQRMTLQLGLADFCSECVFGCRAWLYGDDPSC